MKDFVKLKRPKKILDNAHTMSIVDFRDHFFAYQGGVKWEGINIRVDEILSKESFKNTTAILYGLRWASAIVKDDKVYLFCTKQIPHDGKNIYERQEIWLYESSDGFNFKEIRKVVDGSAPNIFQDGELYFLYYHTRNPHTIRMIFDPFNSFSGGDCSHEIIISEEILSAPSVVYLNGFYWMLCEELIGGKWNTILFKGTSPVDFKRIKKPFIKNAACAFQHILFDEYILTYSVPVEGFEKWKMMIAKGDIK